MNKSINLSDKASVRLRKIIGVMSIVLSIASLTTVVLGVPPIYQQRSTPITVVYNLIDIINITSKPLVYCLLKFVFSLLYILVLVLIIKDIVVIIKNSRPWIKEKHDTGLSRMSVSKCVMTQNIIFIKLVVLTVVSYMLDSFRLGFWGKFILITLILGNFLINCMKMFLIKRNALESIMGPAVTTLTLLCVVLFMFNVFDVELGFYFKSIANYIRVLFNTKDLVPQALMLQIFISNVLVPSIYIYTLVVLTMSFIFSTSYGVGFKGYERFCKINVIVGAIAVGAITILEMIVGESINPLLTWKLLLDQWELVLFEAAVWLLSKNYGSTLQNAHTYDELRNRAEEMKVGDSTICSATETNE